MHALMLVLLYLLMGTVVWLLWQALPAAGAVTALVAVLLTLPLALPLPALWRRKRAAALWTGYLLAPYLALALMEAVANPAARLTSALVTLLVLLTLFALVAWLRTSRPDRG
jgi:uncharacterized membrane protein